jgi:PHD/YefM family antitoxin component YafN of YafNO toxin-antitoxin module
LINSYLNSPVNFSKIKVKEKKKSLLLNNKTREEANIVPASSLKSTIKIQTENLINEKPPVYQKTVNKYLRTISHLK